MTAKDYLKQYPKLETDFSNAEYFRRVARIAKENGATYSAQYFKKMFYHYKKEWKTVKTSHDRDGNVTHSTKKIVVTDTEIPKHLVPTRVTTNPNGENWVRYSQGEYVPPEITEELLSKAYSKIKPIKITPVIRNTGKLCIGWITDIHVGMDINDDGFAMYGGKWNAKELNKRKADFVSMIIDKSKGCDSILINDLGDLMDGWNGETLRGGHALPQNMDNVQAFEVAVDFKVSVIQELYKTGLPIKAVNIVCDNHSGDFSTVVNIAAQKILSYSCPNIEYVIQRKFIDHYIYGKHCFILTHGKDDKNLKFGFKDKLEPKAAEKIKEYIDHYKLHKYYVTFCKGDTHLQVFDQSREDFEYLSFMAFSPSSEWVRVNFQKGVSGFTVMTVHKNQDVKEFCPIKYKFK